MRGNDDNTLDSRVRGNDIKCWAALHLAQPTMIGMLGVGLAVKPNK